MAKKKVTLSKKLMPYKEVTVKSLSYGEHTRAARGSQTPVAINEVLQANADKTLVINKTAKRVHDLLKYCGKGFKEAMLWQVILGRMRKASSKNPVDLLVTLKNMELNSRYRLSRFAHPFLRSVVWGKDAVDITLGASMRPHIKSSDTQYLYELHLLLIGAEPEQDGIVSGRTQWIETNKETNEIVFSFEVPPAVKYYLVCLHFMTGVNNRETGTLASRGMKIMSAGKIEMSLI